MSQENVEFRKGLFAGAADMDRQAGRMVYAVCTFRTGKLACCEGFYEERDALQAAGLSE
jgi:hypothetical protein